MKFPIIVPGMLRTTQGMRTGPETRVAATCGLLPEPRWMVLSMPGTIMESFIFPQKSIIFLISPLVSGMLLLTALRHFCGLMPMEGVGYGP